MSLRRAEEALKRAMYFLTMPHHDHLVGRELHEAWRQIRVARKEEAGR